MAENKKKKNVKVEEEQTKKLPAAKKRTSSSDSNENKSSRPPRTPREPIRDAVPDEPSAKFIHQFMPFVLGIAAVLLAACFLWINLSDSTSAVGVVGQWLNDIFCGLFGWPVFFLPLILLNLAVFWGKYVDMGLTPLKLSFSFLTLLAISALVHVVTIHSLGSDGFDIGAMWRNAIELRGGGVLGGLLGELFYLALGIVGSLIVLIPGILTLLTFLFGTTPRAIVLHIKYYLKRSADRRRERRAELEELEDEDDEPVISRKEQKRAEKQKKKADEDRRRRHEILEEAVEPPQKAVFTENDKSLDERDNAPAANVGTITLGESIEPAPAPAPAPIESIPLTPAEPDKTVLEPIRRAPSEQNSTLVEQLKKDDDFNDLNDILQGAVPAKAIDKQEKKPKVVAEEQKPEAETELGLITDVEDMSELMETDEELPAEEEKTEYVFPPYELLAQPTESEEDFAQELRDNAKRLMDTLSSFKIRIKEINYSRGPTITRYELRPDDGVRIRSIANLVDDIALSLATAGVRIEAPIPGKSAVGVEVPNQHQATVYLRSLIESQTFIDTPSRLAVCLGQDVAGKPIYFNIDKMPHLLIAGATGMGKSVCINSLIISLLYKAKPDEVKLILVDPKKVEFNIYKDIPHLYVPVVSDPKKAAGVLATAVAEMERRFELIEEVNVRDITNYNRLAENDPELTPMPRIVIIIDELADLMMTASADVETAICRLAQKARAAGIHLIIGTQRPSVDVITGLIKANIPSRIACKVSSQVDSRTIIDIGGAEKLIGRGDMLFAPVGAMKPIRVQGAFVGDMEVENIVEFIKEHNAAAHYDAEFIKRIEEEAAKCGNNKKGGGSEANIEDVEGDNMDPKLRDAIELAIESGKISTSLMQRRLEVGYGRAAKILDQMESLGYISPAEGNKPRRVLITKEQYMEKVINDDV
ncbi:MAG: DNA translocase FtsK [Clostridia bacterium]|nr:DNA translocase FtsK [Clostridia bacterium]